MALTMLPNFAMLEARADSMRPRIAAPIPDGMDQYFRWHVSASAFFLFESRNILPDKFHWRLVFVICLQKWKVRAL
jgi:hypothetical protein